MAKKKLSRRIRLIVCIPYEEESRISKVLRWFFKNNRRYLKRK